ncbi:phage tail tube protein [Clostridium botulinum]|uniref:Core tail protein n=2 Tax=Clostridium botulinum TaxID=1491 RepID=A7GFT8_CLOBL|nr:phage tail tube protein [Clostridium botulinum]ABS41727.1 core tail protein [Clostridium botulinum F str. Langeland]ADG00058.1 core tail protein [Clostridium botulinum F str. 230613]KGO12765.1 phage portal protein [Clostridium botulinum]KKM42389.1 phage portal protein [Clostridium botulinum]MBY6793128.1 phage tail tube protein [Clostridium botulinum]
MSFLEFKDTISGQEGRAYATIDGRNEELFYAKKIESKVEKEKSEGKTLGKRGTQSKAKGYKGTGTLTIYYITSLFREMMIKYMKEGIDTYFDMTVVNEDPTSTVGKQTTVLKNCNLDECPMALLDVDSDSLEEEIGFTFDDVDLLDKFSKPVLG